MAEKRKVILVADGDEYAKRTLERVSADLNCRCISMSQGNPSVLSGPQLVQLIKKAAHDPVLVMFDDCGYVGEGAGEIAMRYVAGHEDIEVLGIIAVASKTHHREWTKVDVCIDRDCQLTEFGVDKYGAREQELGRITGDTVYCVDQLNAPVVVGIGDIGKMSRRDYYKIGSPVTRLAIEIILERSGYNGYKTANNDTDSETHR
ncbi:stage V sporulation protein AE [Peribacillus saganii]|uniref:Stage V sporulation protein AE n=1 Tax=Peribacillus saganii TaxID=2303992 RepID=A0A372LMV9_9BACI|nr:stage V sporulation protein AE [Peribacillus saganii]RFU67784.1 stage V sporulation protein AE [Peribacillus saganii]